jgi:eukaryotic-like serine/threonine-protein kinase
MRLACVRCNRDLDDAKGRPSFCPFCGNPLPPPDDDRTTPADPLATTPAGPADGVPLDIPERVGPYRLLRRIGAGGMGTVYEAEEDGSGRRVALKLIAPRYGASPDAVERFRREGRLAGLIAHPRCVFVLAADEEAGRPYLVMELMSGETLHDLVRRRGPLPPEGAVSRALDVIAGLEEVHRHGIIHRDVKPSNCFLDHEGRVKVGDFGLARSLETDARLTRTGSFLGTPLFASPEQLKGQAVDQRGDVYAVAATLYFLLTGRAPHEGSDMAAVAARIASEPAPPLRSVRPELSAGLERIVRRGLERQPERRYRDLEAFCQALLPFAPPGELSIGGMGRRLIAVLIDALIVCIPALGLRILAGETLLKPGPGYVEPEGFALWFPRVLNGCLIALVVLYFGLLEGRWGCSLGKRLLRLRVTRSSQGTPAGVARALLRTLLFGLLLWLPFPIFDILPLDCLTKIFLGMLLWTQIPGAFLVMSTMRARNGYRGLHEFLSGTRTVQLPWPGKQPRPSPLLSPPGVTRFTKRLTHSGIQPATVGPFHILGALGGGLATFLVGEDTVLGRKILLWLRSADAAPPGANRREVGRRTRLRWLTGGVEGIVRWDAFVAPTGRPVTDIVAAAGPLPWAEVRPLLAQLTEELAAACSDQTLPERLRLDQVLVRADGEVELLDAPVTENVGAADGDAPNERALRLLRDFVVLTLEGKSRSAGDVAAPVRRPLPLCAAATLAYLFGAEPLAGSVVEFQQRLTAVRDRPARVTRPARALHLLVQGVLLFVLLFVLLILPRGSGSFFTVWFGSALPLVVLGMSLGWAILLRSGPSFPMAGVALVRSDGRRAARWQAGWRSALVWAQGVVPLIVLSVTRWQATVPGEELQLFPLALTLWAILTAWLPRRTLHDRLAGTHIVPE